MMPAVAVTDTNNIFGALEFSDAAAKSGVQPIIGCQLSIVGTRVGSGDPMVFLVVNETGYRNLLKLLSSCQPCSIFARNFPLLSKEHACRQQY